MVAKLWQDQRVMAVLDVVAPARLANASARGQRQTEVAALRLEDGNSGVEAVVVRLQLDGGRRMEWMKIEQRRASQW